MHQTAAARQPDQADPVRGCGGKIKMNPTVQIQSVTGRSIYFLLQAEQLFRAKIFI